MIFMTWLLYLSCFFYILTLMIMYHVLCKIYLAAKFIIIGIVIIIMIVSYIFKIIEAGNNEPFWVTPSTCG